MPQLVTSPEPLMRQRWLFQVHGLGERLGELRICRCFDVADSPGQGLGGGSLAAGDERQLGAHSDLHIILTVFLYNLFSCCNNLRSIS